MSIAIKYCPVVASTKVTKSHNGPGPTGNGLPGGPIAMHGSLGQVSIHTRRSWYVGVLLDTERYMVSVNLPYSNTGSCPLLPPQTAFCEPQTS